MEVTLKLEIILPHRLLTAIERLSSIEKQPEIKNTARTPLGEASLSRRVARILECVGIKYVEELEYLKEGTLLRIDNFGRKSLNEIKEECKRFGVTIGRISHETPDIRNGEKIREFFASIRGEKINVIAQ